jgi:hypothetical protein
MHKPFSPRRRETRPPQRPSIVKSSACTNKVVNLTAPLRIAVGIATAGRPDSLAIVIEELDKQQRPADCVIVCAPTEADAMAPSAAPAGLQIVFGPRGLTCQRNEILRRTDGFDVVVFFDDDFLPAPSYLAAVEQVFLAYPNIALVTGLVVADGILGPGLDLGEARRALAAAGSATVAGGPTEVLSGYGCNMAIRVAPARAARICFDENLPLYGWLEDLDFSRQLARCGRIVRTREAQGVHLGIKRGRQSGLRLGYSQIANPIYLVRKGTCPWPVAFRLMSRNVLANCVKSLRPEPYVDRPGRMAGNLRAVRDFFAGSLHPQRILEL